jgi:outer membrane protein insertion porin family
LSAAQIIGTAGIALHRSTNYREIQRAITALFGTQQFDDVVFLQQELPGGGLGLLIRVTERPLLVHWAVRGPEKVSEKAVREHIHLIEGRALDRAALARSVAAVDSLYRARGYYTARTQVIETPEGDNKVRILFAIEEGRPVAISEVIVDGNRRFSDQEIVSQMASRPEGFWWFRRGHFDDSKLERDVREGLPRWYGSHGYVDFQVLHDTLEVDSINGKAVLRLGVDEGQQYQVGTFDITGNRRFSTDELTVFYPFGVLSSPTIKRPFDQGQWDAATDRVRDLYANSGYIYAQIDAEQVRRTTPDGTAVIDLRWTIREGSPATVNKIEIVGNDITHERVIRDAIVILPGELFSRDRLLRSYQNISNLGFFQQPMPPPDIQPTANGVDVDVVFRVQEKRTGSINFGASIGQGTGLGAFVGLEEPNLFGRGKRGRLNLQFGRNIFDLSASYTDPAIRESRISGTVTAYNSRQRYIVGDLGRQYQTGASIQLGFPVLGSRYTRLFTSYGFQWITYKEGSQDLQAQYKCTNCTRSTLGFQLVRDTRVDMPFPTSGAYGSGSLEFNGGPLGGTGDYRKLNLEAKWFAPLGSIGTDPYSKSVRFLLGLTARSGFIFGDPGPFFTELFAMGGTYYGIPLRGYDEFSITPNGFDPLANSSTAAGPNSFGRAFAQFTAEAGARISGQFYVNTFLDAGNNYRTPSQWDPTRLFRGAGFGLALISPLGPLGLDIAYGFDKVDQFGRKTPGWKVHFKLGNFF